MVFVGTRVTLFQSCFIKMLNSDLIILRSFVAMETILVMLRTRVDFASLMLNSDLIFFRSFVAKM